MADHQQKAEKHLAGIRSVFVTIAGTDDPAKVKESLTPEGVEAAYQAAPLVQALAQTAQAEALLHLADVIESKWPGIR